MNKINAKSAATINKPIVASHELPVRNETNDNAESKITPWPASRALNPARKLNVVVAPTIPKGIKISGYNRPKLTSPINGIDIMFLPAFIAIKGIDQIASIINLDLFDKPPCCQPNKSSTRPIPPAIKITTINEII